VAKFLPLVGIQRRSNRLPLVGLLSLPPLALLFGIIVVAVGLRAYWIIHHDTLLLGLTYVRITENLLNERSYVGLFEGPELIFPPFFPVLLALGSLLVGSVSGSARLIPFISGVLLVPIAFALVRLMYGLRAALGIAALIAIHPVFIDLSSTAESETVYLPLILAGLYWGLRALDSGSIKHTVWCGTMFGFAYLTRPEALLFPFVVLTAVVVTGLRNLVLVRRVAFQCLCLVAPIAVLAAPYVAYLSLHTGGLRLDTKGIMNYTIGERRNLGMTHAEASLGIGSNLAEDGPQLSPNHFIAAAHQTPSMRELVSYWVKSALRNKATLFDLLLSPAFGSALGIGLAALGLFRRPWDQRRAVWEAVLLSIALAHVFLLLGLHVVLFRYVLPLTTVSLLWVAKGIDEFARWGMQTASRVLSLGRSPRRRIDMGIRAGLIVALLLLALWGLRWGSPLQEGPGIALLQEAGTWLGHYRPGPKRVMAMHAQVPYYSHGTLLLMPYAEASLALRYVHMKHPDFIVLVEEDRFIAPYMNQWLNDGIPDRSAALIYQANGVAIYEWHG
jgi:4-amino-4-deoxy-L-arabinose transferase-like glycosyltransferase